MAFANPSPTLLASLNTLELLFTHLRLPAGTQDALHDLLGSDPGVDPVELAMLTTEQFDDALEPLMPTLVPLTRSRVGYIWRYLQLIAGFQTDHGQETPLASTAQALPDVRGGGEAQAFSFPPEVLGFLLSTSSRRNLLRPHCWLLLLMDLLRRRWHLHCVRLRLAFLGM